MANRAATSRIGLVIALAACSGTTTIETIPAPALEQPADFDSFVLEQLEGAGADLTEPRHIRHFLIMPTEDSANEVAETAAGEWETQVLGPDDGFEDWLVVAEGTKVVDAGSVARWRETFEAEATRLGGFYDGWEAASDPGT